MKFNRTKALATYINRHLGEKMKEKVEEKKHENFIDFINKGGQLTMKELKELNSVYKADYIKKILENDK